MSVITALEFEDFLTMGECAGETDGRKSGFCAGVDHAHHFNARYHLNYLFREQIFEFRGRAETGGLVKLRMQRR